MVRIESPEELEFVKTLIAQSQSPDFWIDGNDEASEGVWVDAEGEPLTYLPWPPGCPDNDWDCEHVAELFGTANSTTRVVGLAGPLFVNGIGNPWPQLTWAVPAP